jgi:hypothetical protein
MALLYAVIAQAVQDRDIAFLRSVLSEKRLRQVLRG